MVYDKENWTYNDETKILQIKRVKELRHYMFECFNHYFGVFRNPREYKVIIPDSIVLIANSCFQNMDAKEYVLPNSIKEIGLSVFYDNPCLKVIQWPSSVKNISGHAFEYCNGLREIVLPEGIEMICDYAFEGCQLLKKITIPSTVVEINDNAFQCCYNLKRIQLQEGLQYIGKFAFYCCGLEKIVIPTTVEELGEYVFTDCKNLKEIHVPRALYRKYVYSYFKSNTHAEVIPYDEPMNLSTNTIAKPEIITANTIETTTTSKREFKSFNGVIRTNLIANKKKK